MTGTTRSAHLCLVQPEGYVHSSALADPMRYVRHQLEQLGVGVTEALNELSPTAVNLVLGAHLGFDTSWLDRADCVVVNLEQLGRDASSWPAEYVELLRRAVVVDYHPDNRHAYRDPAHVDDVPLISFGHAPYLWTTESEVPLAQRPVDLLFVGSLTRRRLAVFERLNAAGVRLHVPAGPVYGRERDALVRSAKAVLNVGAYDSPRFEQVRASLVLSCGTPLVSERRGDLTGVDAPFADVVEWFDLDEAVDRLRADVRSSEHLRRAEERVRAFRAVDPHEQYRAMWAAVLDAVGPGRRATPLGTSTTKTTTTEVPVVHATDLLATPTPRVSVVIPLFNRADLTGQCLAALVEHTPEDLYEVVLVDNGSTDGTAELLAGLGGDVTVISNPENRGFAAACNQGAAAARGDVVLLLNNDVIVTEGWLEPLVDVLDRQPDVGAVGSLLLYPDGKVQHAGVLLIDTPECPLTAVNALRGADTTDSEALLHARTYQAVTGALVAFRREAFTAAGGFDEGYWNGLEDVDLCLRLGRAGWKVVYEPRSVAVHLESQSGPERFAKVTENVVRFVQRWLPLAVPDLLVRGGCWDPHPAAGSEAAAQAWRRSAAVGWLTDAAPASEVVQDRLPVSALVLSDGAGAGAVERTAELLRGRVQEVLVLERDAASAARAGRTALDWDDDAVVSAVVARLGTPWLLVVAAGESLVVEDAERVREQLRAPGAEAIGLLLPGGGCEVRLHRVGAAAVGAVGSPAQVVLVGAHLADLVDQDRHFEPAPAVEPTVPAREAVAGPPTELSREDEARIERVRERAAAVEERRLLQVVRDGRDVCWLEDEGDDNPLVTVRIATYNRGQMVVDRAISSALTQTYPNIEVLVVGDACDEATERAVRSVRDPRVRFVNLGQRGIYPTERMDRWRVAGTAPMNAALALARGSWIAPCDDDDQLTPDHVEVLLRHAKQNRLEMVWSQAAMEVREGEWALLGSEPLRINQVSHGTVLYSLGLRFFQHSNTSWKMDEPGDWNLWRRMAAAGVRTGFLPQITYLHYLEAHARPEREADRAPVRI
ncbi:glycosyltransferase [Kineococcus arenarius]|uniref:glycosyltransferase n=1 Tax=unclassified Kineococcus TaxID=2621656 RepID=UPI003D7C730D